ncbi:unnamed protein product [Pleuronectes platessa]|uniref:Orc1-like AAA ATPase domain-containing protein n=1 Tax=Pleuronectes platessa TaxID=8262 RepID=A0A9N7TWR6_PLEPL|nr:unnamed protein product [Pleuronectes platessa]
MSGHREQMSSDSFDGNSSLLQGRRFYCRKWALEKLRHCLDTRSVPGQPPGLLVMGGPGAGKTALCTEVVWPTSKAGLAAGLATRCLASHFCQREDQRSMVLWKFVLGLVEQLRASPLLSPGYRKVFDSPSVSSALEPVNCQKDPDDTFKRAVLRPLLDLPPPAQTLMLVVDSLDVGYGPDTGSGNSSSIAELLATNQHLLPGWLLLVCSVRRHNKAVCKIFSGFRKLCLDDLRKPPPVHDVQQYILCRLDEDAALRRQLTPDTADMLNLLHIKSGGCFLFLERVLDGVAVALVGLREIRDIPGTLNGLYLWLCQRLFPRGLFMQGHVKVLTVLLEWAKKQHPETAAQMMEHVDNEGWTALRSAAWGGHSKAVHLLLDAGADVDGCDGEARTALRAAAWGGHEEIVLTLLDYGAQVDKADSKGRTPLIAAAYMGHHEAVEILLDRNAEVDLADGDGRTALSVAALCVPTAAGIKSYGEVASLLLERGADPGHRDHDGMTPLLLAAYEGHEEVVELLLEAGADVDETAGPDGNVPAAAAVTPLLAAAAMGHMKTVSRLLFWGAAVDAIDCEGRTALCLAAARGSTEVVRALLDRGLDENHKDDLGWTPMHAAACEGHRAVCAALTERGSMARVGEMDIEGRTPLILAAQEGHLSTVRLLLDRRSPIDHRAYDGHSALSATLLEGHAEVAELLMRRGADTDVRDAEGRPLLYLLVLEGHLEMATLLMEKGGVPLESRDSEGRTALHVASWQGCVEMVDLLLKHGSNPNAQDTEGRPPMHSVAWTGNAEVGRRLLDARCVNIDLSCNQGATSLSIAAQEGHDNIVAMLLERAANPDHMDKYGRSPVKVAGKHGHFNIVRLLERYGAKPYIGPSLNSSTTSPAKINRILSSGISECNRGEVTAATSSSSVSSPASTAERYDSMQSSQTSSTCHSLSTVQTVPADSLSFIQQIQQHSLPRSRSRHSTLPPPGSLQGSIQRHPKGSTPPSVCTVTAMVHNCKLPQKVLSPELEYHDKMSLEFLLFKEKTVLNMYNDFLGSDERGSDFSLRPSSEN